MEITEVKKILDRCGIQYVKSEPKQPLSIQELNNLRFQLSKTNFVEIIDGRNC